MTTLYINNQLFNSFQDVADHYRVSRDLIYTRVHCYGWALEEAIKTAKHGKLTKNITSFDNNYFPSIKSAAAFYHLNAATLSQRLTGGAKLTKEMVTPPKFRNKTKKPREKTGTKPPGYYSKSYFEKGDNKLLTGFIYLALIPVKREKFIKIGITKHEDIKTRLNQLPRGSEIIFSETSTLYKCWLVEQSILQHRFIDEPNYSALTPFHGYTELLSTNMRIIEPLKKFIKKELLHH